MEIAEKQNIELVKAKRGRPKDENSLLRTNKKEYNRIHSKKFHEMSIPCDVCGVMLNYFSMTKHKMTARRIANIENQI